MQATGLALRDRVCVILVVASEPTGRTRWVNSAGMDKATGQN